MFTKPCERADRGCDGLAKADTLKKLEARRFCSLRCCAIERVAGGHRPDAGMTRTQRATSGRSGGTESGARRRRAVMLKAIGSVEAEAQIAIERSGSRLRPRDFKAIEYLLANVYLEGWRRGSQARWRKNKTAEQAQKVTEAAA